MGLNISSNQYPEAMGFGALGQIVKGHVQGGPFNQQFIEDTVSAANGTNPNVLPGHLVRPELPPPIGPVSLVFSLSNVFNENPDATPTDSQNQEPTLSDNQAVITDNFYQQLGQNTTLNDSDRAKLQFAFFNPDVDISNVKLSDGSNLKEVLKGLVDKTIAASIDQGIDVSKVIPLVDNKSFNLNISDAFDGAFEELVNKSNLTPEEKGTLIFAHYNPNTPIPNADPKLLAQLKGFETSAAAQISAQFGTPVDFQPKVNSAIYNAGLEGGFKVNLQLAFNAVTAGLSDDDIKGIQNAIQNMNDPSIPANIKATAQKILDKAISQTQLENNLPVGFQPSAADMADIFNSIASDPITAGFIQTRELLNTTIQKIQLLMPEGPEKKLTLDLLQTITAAIIKAQQSIYELQQSHSETARSQSTAKLGMQEQQIRERQEQGNEIAEQTGKQQTMQKVMDVLGPIMKAFEIVMAIATAGLFAAVFVALDMHFNFMNMAIEGIVKGVSDVIDQSIPDDGNPKTAEMKHALKAFTQVVVLTAMMAAGVTILFSLLGGSVLMNLGMKMVTESTVIKEFCLAVGVPEKDIQWVVLAVTLAITIAVTVVSFINPGSAVEQAPSTAVKVTKTALDTADDVARAVDSTLDIVQSSATIASKAEGIASNLNVVDDVAIQSQNIAQKVLTQVSDSLNEVFSTLINQIKSAKSFKKLMELVDDVNTRLHNLDPKLLSRTMQAFNVTQTAVSATNSGLQGASALVQRNIAQSKGKHEAAIAELEAMIKNLQKVLNSILEGLSDFGDELQSLNGVLDNLLTGLQQTLNKTTSIQIS